MAAWWQFRRSCRPGRLPRRRRLLPRLLCWHCQSSDARPLSVATHKHAEIRQVPSRPPLARPTCPTRHLHLWHSPTRLQNPTACTAGGTVQARRHVSAGKAQPSGAAARRSRGPLAPHSSATQARVRSGVESSLRYQACFPYGSVCMFAAVGVMAVEKQMILNCCTPLVFSPADRPARCRLTAARPQSGVRGTFAAAPRPSALNPIQRFHARVADGLLGERAGDEHVCGTHQFVVRLVPHPLCMPPRHSYTPDPHTCPQAKLAPDDSEARSLFDEFDLHQRGRIDWHVMRRVLVDEEVHARGGNIAARVVVRWVVTTWCPVLAGVWFVPRSASHTRSALVWLASGAVG